MLSAGNVEEGTTIIALNQHGGKGRHGRKWLQAKDNLYFSFLIKPECPLQDIGQISLLVGVALAQTLEIFINTDHQPQLKWPNDVLIDNKKCAGVLLTTDKIENMHAQNLIIGIGLNIAQTPHQDFTCLQAHCFEKALSSDIILEKFTVIFSALFSKWKKNGFFPIKKIWLQYCPFINKKITVKNIAKEISGTFKTIDDMGNLVIICSETNETVTINTGDVFLESEIK